MSEHEPDQGPPIEHEGDGLSEMPTEAPRRAASIMLRPEDVREARAATLEAANKSLADALNIIYRLLQLLMIGLVALFLLSGFQQVNESESGIKVTLGKITQANVPPGFVPSLPYPLGEVIKVETSQVALDVDKAFWPNVGDGNLNRPLRSAMRNTLKVEEDGALFTSDAALVHAQWSVKYRRTDPELYYQKLFVTPENRRVEQELVSMAIERAAVHAVATTSIDAVLKGQGGGAGVNLLEQRVRELAQETLDTMESGLAIDSVTLKQKSPPQRTIASFEEVNNAVAKAAQDIEQARIERTQKLAETAGSAADPLLALIDLYESQVDLGQAQQSEETFALIRQLLDGDLNGQDITIDGRTFPAVSIAGAASRLITRAQTAASTRAAEAERRARDFEAALAQYRASPRVFIANVWSRAMDAALSHGREEVFFYPVGSEPRLWINSDPQVLRKVEENADKFRQGEDKSLARGRNADALDRDTSLEEEE